MQKPPFARAGQTCANADIMTDIDYCIQTLCIVFSTDVVKTSVSRTSVPRRTAVHSTTRLKDASSSSRAIRLLLLRNCPKYNMPLKRKFCTWFFGCSMTAQGSLWIFNIMIFLMCYHFMSIIMFPQVGTN